MVTVEIMKADAHQGLTPAAFDARLKALKRLVHPSIARVLDGRLTSTGDCCIVAEYVPGPPLASYCDSCQLALADRLELLLAVCDAIEHAHAEGVVHGRLAADSLVVTGTGEHASAAVTGFGMCSAKATFADDLNRLSEVLDAVTRKSRLAEPANLPALSGRTISATAFREAVEVMMRSARLE